MFYNTCMYTIVTFLHTQFLLDLNSINTLATIVAVLKIRGNQGKISHHINVQDLVTVHCSCMSHTGTSDAFM